MLPEIMKESSAPPEKRQKTSSRGIEGFLIISDGIEVT